MRNRWNSAERIKHVRCPILFIHGAQDEIINVSHSERLFKLCPSKKKSFFVCNQATHTYFKEPGDTIEPIMGFLKLNFAPNESPSILIAEIQDDMLICPQRIVDRETEERNKESAKQELDTQQGSIQKLEPNFSLETTSEVGCGLDIFSWFSDVSNVFVEGSRTFINSLSVNSNSSSEKVGN